MKVLFVLIGVLLLSIAWISVVIFSIKSIMSYDGFEEEDDNE